MTNKQLDRGIEHLSDRMQYRTGGNNAELTGYDLEHVLEAMKEPCKENFTYVKPEKKEKCNSETCFWITSTKMLQRKADLIRKVYDEWKDKNRCSLQANQEMWEAISEACEA